MNEGMPAVPGEPARLDSLVARVGPRDNVRVDAGLQAQAASEDHDLRTSLAALSQLATGQMELSDVLTRVAELAVFAIPGADGAGLTLLEAGHPYTIVASAPFVADVDAVQYGIEEGPCISAAAHGRTVRSGELGTDPQWPRFGPRIANLGVHSALSIPLLTPAGVLGAMNVYGRQRDAFDEQGARIGELFAAPAAIAVQNAQVLAQTKRLATHVHQALSNRVVIDQATGILMSRFGCSADEASEQLHQMSQNEHLYAIASRIVEGAVRLARAGNANPWRAAALPPPG
jgi:GAF domain-containing protein